MDYSKLNLFLYCISLLVHARVSYSVPTIPPVWPNTFHVDFQEMAYLRFLHLFNNNGSWYYDFTHKQARFDHLRGQKDWLCMNQHLSDHDKQAPCSLIFSNDTNLYIHYPEAKTCCKLCGKDKYCTAVKPTWLQNATYIGEEIINGKKCQGWQTPGFTFMDSWYITEGNIPCRYHEKSDHLGTIHNITFNENSFKLGAINADVFEVPHYCQDKCPNPMPADDIFRKNAWSM